MCTSELAGLMACAEHLLWVIARCDVENLSGHRDQAMRRLHAIEARALDLGVSDLYREVLQAAAQHS